jgi:hypothetical protein
MMLKYLPGFPVSILKATQVMRRLEWNDLRQRSPLAYIITLMAKRGECVWLKCSSSMQHSHEFSVLVARLNSCEVNYFCNAAPRPPYE